MSEHERRLTPTLNFKWRMKPGHWPELLQEHIVEYLMIDVWTPTRSYWKPIPWEENEPGE